MFSFFQSGFSYFKALTQINPELKNFKKLEFIDQFGTGIIIEPAIFKAKVIDGLFLKDGDKFIPVVDIKLLWNCYKTVNDIE